MESFTNLFNVVLYQPLFNVLVMIYRYLPGHDFGMAVILLTVLIRLALYFPTLQALKSQKILSELQPKIKEIQERFKNDKEKQAKETMALYQKERINPFGGCLPLLIQLPILFAIYQVFWKGFQPETMNLVYSFLPRPEQINPMFLGVVNMATPSLILAILAGVVQFFQAWHQNKFGSSALKPKGKRSDHFSGMLQKQMLYFFPIFTVFILFKLPSAVGLYWLATSLFSILQQHLV